MLSEKEKSFPIKEFKVQNLFGTHSSLVFNMKTGLTAFIGANGTGKTTALIALYALATQNSDLLRGVPAENLILTFSKGEVFNYYLLTSHESDVLQKIQEIVRCTFCEARDILLDLIKEERDPFTIIRRFNRRKGNMGRRTVREILADLEDSVLTRLEEVEKTRGVLNKVQNKTLRDLRKRLDGWDVLFFPTFRSIEVGEHIGEVAEECEEGGIEVKYNRELRSLMHYSLEEIKYYLKTLSSRVIGLTNDAYGNATEKLIRYVLLDKQKNKISKIDSVKANRIKNALSILGLFEEKDLDIITKNLLTKSGKSDGNDTKKEVVDYFVLNLYEGLGGIDSIQERLRGFCETLNEYFEGKELHLDTRTLEVILMSGNKSVLDWDSLSSGEKQITGILGEIWLRTSNPSLLFRFLKDQRAKEALVSTKKLIVLIDEPELSLGIEWQNRFLQDIMRAPNCKQLIVTTHSPSIVKELEPNETQPVRSRRI